LTNNLKGSNIERTAHFIAQANRSKMNSHAETHNIVVGYILWIFGFFGFHRFYYGYKLLGIIYLFTGGLFLIGWIIDLFLIPSMQNNSNRRYRAGSYDYNISWLLLFFLGYLGVHRFYLGKIGTGILWLLTAGLLGFGLIYDFLTLNEQVSTANFETHS
jgi:TM2 domain-containing membrane protein YozV